MNGLSAMVLLVDYPCFFPDGQTKEGLNILAIEAAQLESFPLSQLPDWLSLKNFDAAQLESFPLS